MYAALTRENCSKMTGLAFLPLNALKRAQEQWLRLAWMTSGAM